MDVELKKEKKSLASFDKEVSGFEQEKRTKKQELENGKLDIQRLGHDRQGLVTERDAASRHIAKLLSENPWIPDQKGYACYSHCICTCVDGFLLAPLGKKDRTSTLEARI